MQRVVNNDYVDATLAALFVAVVIAMTIFGLIALVRALGSPSSTSAEVGGAEALPGAVHG
jgi:carbon starvation protein